MAHLVVCRETIIENVPTSREAKTLSIGKHPRALQPPNEALQYGAIGVESKRRALGSITNTLVPSNGYGNRQPLTKPGLLQENIQVIHVITRLIRNIAMQYTSHNVHFN